MIKFTLVKLRVEIIRKILKMNCYALRFFQCQ